MMGKFSWVSSFQMLIIFELHWGITTSFLNQIESLQPADLSTFIYMQHITLTSSKGKRSWKMRLILAPPDSSTVSTWSPEPSILFSKSTENCCTILEYKQKSKMDAKEEKKAGCSFFLNALVVRKPGHWLQQLLGFARRVIRPVSPVFLGLLVQSQQLGLQFAAESWQGVPDVVGQLLRGHKAGKKEHITIT